MNPQGKAESFFSGPFRWWHPLVWFVPIVGSTASLPAYANAIQAQHPLRAQWLFALFGFVCALALVLWPWRRWFSAWRFHLLVTPVLVAVAVAALIIVYPFGIADPLNKFESLEWMPGWAWLVWVVTLGLVIGLPQYRRRSKGT